MHKLDQWAAGHAAANACANNPTQLELTGNVDTSAAGQAGVYS